MAGPARVGKLVLAVALVTGGAVLFFAGLAAQLTPARARSSPEVCDAASARALRLLRIWREERTATEERAYLKLRPALDAARFLRAEFEIVSQREHEVPSGRHIYTYVLVKETPTGPWRIADWMGSP